MVKPIPPAQSAAAKADTNSPDPLCPAAIWARLTAANRRYADNLHHTPALHYEQRVRVSEAPHKPDTVVVTCSDSRVSPEHIFGAELGEIFVIRTAGNTLGAFALGSIEYALSVIGAKLLIVLGHEQCGAVACAMDGTANGYMQELIQEIQHGIGDCHDYPEAISRNVFHSLSRCLESSVIRALYESGEVCLLPAMYHMQSGEVTLLPSEAFPAPY